MYLFCNILELYAISLVYENYLYLFLIHEASYNYSVSSVLLILITIHGEEEKELLAV